MKVAFTLKQATKEDIPRLRTEGCVYFMYSLISHKFDPRPYFIHENINADEFNALFVQGSIYLPVDFEEITPNQAV